MVLHKTLRLVAAFEAFKGVLALLAASGLLLLIHQDLHAITVRLVEHAHLNPAAHYPGIFIQAVSHLQDIHTTLIALGAVAYAAMRFAEAYGLYRNAPWAELLGALSGVIYLPLELMELIRHPNGLSVAALTLNLLVVAVMVKALRAHRQQDGAD